MYLEFNFKNTKVSKFLGFSLLLSGAKIFPLWLNTLSIGADVAGTEKIFLTRHDRVGNSFSLTFQNCNAFSNSVVCNLVVLPLPIT